jgi:hypothetical protein
MRLRLRRYLAIVAIVASIVLLLAFLLLAFLAWDSSKGIHVIIVNNSDRTLENVQVVFRGGNIALGQMPNGASRSVVVQPEGESSVVVNYREDNGQSFSHDADVYIESWGYEGSLTMTIEPHGDVRVLNEIRMWQLPVDPFKWLT